MISLDIFKELFDNSTFVAFLGMILGAILTWFTQNSQRKFEYQKILTQQEYQKIENWKDRFINVSSDLLIVLSPTYTRVSKNEVLKLVHKTEVLLNLSIESHKEIQYLLTELALAINNESSKYSYNNLLELHTQLTVAVRNIVALPN